MQKNMVFLYYQGVVFFSTLQVLGLIINPSLATIVYLYFPSLGDHFHVTSAWGAHLPLNKPACMSLGAPGTNPYNLGTHSKCH